MDDGSKTHPIAIAVKASHWILAPFGAMFVATKVAAAIVEALALDGNYKTGAYVGCTSAVCSIFFLAWGYASIRAFVKDEPLPGFSRLSASTFLDMSKRLKTNLPDRKREKVVMASGLSLKLLILDQTLTQLDHFKQLLGTYAREFDRETDFKPIVFHKFAAMMQSLVDDLTYFIQLNESWFELIERIHELPDSVGNIVKNRSDSIGRLSERLEQIFRDTHDATAPASDEEITKYKEIFASMSTELTDTSTEFSELHKSLSEGVRSCRELFAHLN